MLSTLNHSRFVLAVVTLAISTVANCLLMRGAVVKPGFTVVRERGRAWLVGPDGRRQWSFGVCVVDTGVKFDDYDVNNPAYAAWRFYSSKPDWAKNASRVLESGGFNTIGAWSDYTSLLAVPNSRLMMTPIIHSGSSAGFPWLDMWDPKLVKVADDVTKGLIQSLKNDPRIIGYFSDNELGWWKAAVYDWIWKQKTHFTRTRTVNLFRHHYAGSWIRFNQDFEIVGAHSWAELKKSGHPYLRSNARGQAALSEVLTMLADRYYSLCRSQIKKYAPGALYLGDRYISNYYPEVAQVAGKYCDVVSTNLNPDFTDGTYVQFYLQGLEALTHKPLMITEYYMTSRSGRSGNGNDRSGFPVVDTLMQRANGFAVTTLNLLHNPNVVGAHWFQFYDEPKNGRGDGENYNFGLVDTSDQPYSELLAKGQELNLVSEHENAVPSEIQGNSVPFSKSPSDDLTTWNRSLGLVSADQAAPRGDLYVTWTPHGLKLGMVWPEERFGEQYFRSGKVPRACQTTLEVMVNGKRFVFNIDGVARRLKSPAGWESTINPGTTTRLTLNIPASAFGGRAIAAGQKVDFHVRLVSACRAYTTTWWVDKILGPEAKPTVRHPRRLSP